jgi:hypothetical protein
MEPSAEQVSALILDNILEQSIVVLTDLHHTKANHGILSWSKGLEMHKLFTSEVAREAL